jgi:NADPH-dependent 2,4-dienoyl-CoA reductase/sulfur reductase-like enzyme
VPVAPGRKERIAVVGAGPAGLAFSTTAAERGHDVTVFDMADEIGGQFNMAKQVPGKEEFHETIRYFGAMLNKWGVKVALGKKVGVDELKDFDKVIIATGVSPRTPPIPGIDHPKVLSYIDVLRHKVPVGKNVAVIGAGGIGFDVSEFLTFHGEMKTKADDVSVDEYLEEWGVDKMNETRSGMIEVSGGVCVLVAAGGTFLGGGYQISPRPGHPPNPHPPSPRPTLRPETLPCCRGSTGRSVPGSGRLRVGFTGPSSRRLM